MVRQFRWVDLIEKLERFEKLILPSRPELNSKFEFIEKPNFLVLLVPLEPLVLLELLEPLVLPVLPELPVLLVPPMLLVPPGLLGPIVPPKLLSKLKSKQQMRPILPSILQPLVFQSTLAVTS